MTRDPAELRARFIEAAGHASQTFGFGRSIGQIFAHIYFSPRPQTLDDLTEQLGISKGGASMAVRQLEQWSALRRVWVKGDRKAFYETTDAFGTIFRKAMIDLVGRTMESADTLLSEAEAATHGGSRGGKEDADAVFLRDRVGKIKAFRDRALYMWNMPLIRRLLK